MFSSTPRDHPCSSYLVKAPPLRFAIQFLSQSRPGRTEHGNDCIAAAEALTTGETARTEVWRVRRPYILLW